MNDSPTVTRDHYTAFGGIIHVFAKIEFSLQAMIGAMAGIDLSTALFMTAELGFRAKRDCALNIARVHKPKIVADLDDLLGRIQKENALRNSIAHSI